MRTRTPATSALVRTFYSLALLVGTAGLLAPVPVSAEASRFTPVPDRSLDARVLFEPLSTTTLTRGTALKLVPRQGKAAREQFAKGFQVRVFRIAGSDKVPAVLWEFEPCLVFWGNVFQFRGGSDVEEVNLGLLSGLGWLTLQEGRAPTNGRYLLVAEQLDERSDLFRIERGHAMGRYFDKGMYFEVEADRNIDPAAVAAELTAARARRDKVLVSAKQNDPSLNCVRSAAAAGDATVAGLGEPACEDPPLADSGHDDAVGAV